MRKNIKTFMYVITAILPIVLSACSNKKDNDTVLNVKESSTTLVEDTSSDVTTIPVETTIEENGTIPKFV